MRPVAAGDAVCSVGQMPPSVLICGPERLLKELRDTWIFRGPVKRQLASDAGKAVSLLAASVPQLVVFDGALPGALAFAQKLREDPRTRGVSLAVVTPESAGPEEMARLQAVANALLTRPASPEWDERLARLGAVPPRRRVRLPVRLEFVGLRRAGARITGLAHNLSVSGLLVECVMPLPLGDEVTLTLTLPDSDEPLTCRGRVVRQQPPGPSGVSCYGVTFGPLSDHVVGRIKAFVETAG
jgi:DNA-binding response OmpR family regulator